MYKLRLFIPLLLLVACKGGDKGEQKNESSSPTNMHVPIQENYTHLKSVADDLRVRETPDLNAKVVTTLKFGDLVKDLKKKSDTEVEVELFGEKKKGVFHFVRTQSGKEGWVHAAAVEPVTVIQHYKFPQEAELDKVRAYKAFLDKLNPAEPESFKKALEEYGSRFASTMPGTNEAAYLPLREFGTKVMGKSYEWKELKQYEDSEKHPNLWIEQPKPRVNMTYDDYLKRLMGCGLMVSSEEGMFFAQPDPNAIAKYVAARSTSNMREYLTQIALETREYYASDGGLAITPHQVAERMWFWEDFVQKNPSFFLVNECENQFRDYLHVLLLGLDNTPAYDYESKELNADFKDAYSWIIREHPFSRGGTAVKEIFDRLTQNKRILNDDIRKRIDQILDGQYPLYEFEDDKI